MSIFVDVVLVAIFVILLVAFTKNGFVGTISDIGKTWISLFFSAVLNPFVSGRIHEWFLIDPLTKGINNTLTGLVENNPNDYNLAQIFEKLPKGFLGFLEHYEISIAELEAEYGSATLASDKILAEISLKIATPCSEMLSSIIAYVLCFIASLIFFAWLKMKIKQRMSPFFRFLDSVMGLIVGAAIGYCAVFVVSVVTYTIFQVIVVFDANSPVTAVYENSYVFKFITEFDLLGVIKNIWNMIV